jgi:hypothetical protein
MTTNNVSTFLQKIQQGVKPNMFKVVIPSDPAEGATAEDLTILCKSSSLPGSSIGTIEVPYRGRVVKIAGDRTFDNWSATFFVDSEMGTRAFFERWMDKINSHQDNDAQLISPLETDGYSRRVQISQMEKDNTDGGKVLRTYDLWYAFPTSISTIDLAYDSNDQIEEFTVEFQYSYWTVETDDVKTGNG